MRRSLMMGSLAAVVLCGGAGAQNEVVLEKKSNYNDWGAAWDSVYVLKNGISTVAIVPKLGGRVMQYDLGTHQSIYVHEVAKGKLPADGNAMVGGFRQLPSPQSDFGWPSPPKVDYGNYTCTVVKNSSDSVVIYLESPIEDSNLDKYKTHKGLQFARTLTFYKASSRVKVDMVMRNKGTQPMSHGIWDITQSACGNANCWAYFRRGNTLGGGKGFVQYMAESKDAAAAAEAATQWKPDAAPGSIMGVQYLKKVGKIGADCKDGWICFNDRTAGYAYVKTFSYENGKTYPDSGVSVQVYTYDNTYNMIEVEVLGPLTTLAAGDSVKLVENWFAARSLGPVINVTAAGLVTAKLTQTAGTKDTVVAKGVFGVFYPGVVKYSFYDAANTLVGVFDSVQVAPTDSLVVTKKLTYPSTAKSLRLMLFDRAGNSCGMLDSVTLPPVGIKTGGRSHQSNGTGYAITVRNGVLSIDFPQQERCVVEVLRADGKLVYSGLVDGTDRLSLPSLSTGVHLVTVRGEKTTSTKSVCVMQIR